MSLGSLSGLLSPNMSDKSAPMSGGRERMLHEISGEGDGALFDQWGHVGSMKS